MTTSTHPVRTARTAWGRAVAFLFALGALLGAGVARADESELVLPDLASVTFLGMNGRTLLMLGILVCLAGLAFGLVMYGKLKNLPVHKSMLEVSELIYETCKTYLVTQGKFILLLELFIGTIIAVYYGVLRHMEPAKVAVILLASLVGIAGSYGVAWFGIRINTFANSRTAFASLSGKPFPCYSIPLAAGMSIGTMLISTELILMLGILLFIPGHLAGPCFIGFAIGESLGASALRIAGGIFTKIADIGSDLMKIVFKIKEDDARNPGVIADCTGDNAGDSVGPTADGFETYGVTGVALISFILLAVPDAATQVKLLVWLFAMRIMMIIASVCSYWINDAIAKARFANADKMDFEAPLTSLVWITSLVSVVITFVVSYLLIPELGDGTLWWKLGAIITCGTLAGAIIPELVKVFTSTKSGHVKEVVTASREGGASLNVLAGLTAGNFSAYWMGLAIASLMGIGYAISTSFPAGTHARAGHVRVRPRRVRLPRHGPRHDRGRLLRPRDGQRPVRLRALGHRERPEREGRGQAGLRLRPQLRQGEALPRGERRRGQHVQGHGQARPHRHGRRRRHDDDLLDHHAPHARPQERPRQALDPALPVPARPRHGRRGHLLVHGRVHAGRLDGRLPRRRVHQEEHQARRLGREGLRRGQQEGRRHLHASTRRRACSTSS